MQRTTMEVMIKLIGRSQGPPGIIMMMPRVLHDGMTSVSHSEKEDRKGRIDLLAGDEKVELNDERLEGALSEEDEELAARAPERRRGVTKDDEGEDGENRDVRVVGVVDEFALPRQLEDHVSRHRDRRADDGVALDGRVPRVVGEAVLLDLDEGVRGEHANPNDPHVERLTETPFGGVPGRAEDVVDSLEGLVERSWDLEVGGGEGSGDDELGEDESGLLVVLVTDPEGDPDDAEPCEGGGESVLGRRGGRRKRDEQIVTSGEK